MSDDIASSLARISSKVSAYQLTVTPVSAILQVSPVVEFNPEALDTAHLKVFTRIIDELNKKLNGPLSTQTVFSSTPRELSMQWILDDSNGTKNRPVYIFITHQSHSDTLKFNFVQQAIKDT